LPHLAFLTSQHLATEKGPEAKQESRANLFQIISAFLAPKFCMKVLCADKLQGCQNLAKELTLQKSSTLRKKIVEVICTSSRLLSLLS